MHRSSCSYFKNSFKKGALSLRFILMVTYVTWLLKYQPLLFDYSDCSTCDSSLLEQLEWERCYV